MLQNVIERLQTHDLLLVRERLSNLPVDRETNIDGSARPVLRDRASGTKEPGDDGN
ncbi:MAG TPA: hypothetical protein VFK76_12765 [Gaiellaceae bacterium]|nr:hypothetical protein [Gaiellaceae bacterium]